MKLKKLKIIKPGRKWKKKPIKNIKKVILQLKEIILSLLLEESKKTLAKLFASTITKKTITQKMILNLCQKTHYSLITFYNNYY